jgi:filamentous hemagglutinin
MMREEAIKGLTAEQIQNKYSLPNKPTFISDVNVPAETRIRTGTVAANFGGGQGARQYQWINTKVPGSAITNTRPIN